MNDTLLLASLVGLVVVLCAVGLVEFIRYWTRMEECYRQREQLLAQWEQEDQELLRRHEAEARAAFRAARSRSKESRP
uniref:Uncharacterized protein n=1 Tax=Thermogemmatispora argillosa TaxID=2045280 RepID=A0A455T3P5_9CHLR|nr:hypothetical protein KTA_33660 [Thermogemmatispora argillosa]